MREELTRIGGVVAIAGAVFTIGVWWLVVVGGFATPATYGVTLMLSIVALLLLAAGVITLAHAVNRAPLWPAVLCIILALAVQLGGGRLL